MRRVRSVPVPGRGQAPAARRSDACRGAQPVRQRQPDHHPDGGARGAAANPPRVWLPAKRLVDICRYSCSGVHQGSVGSRHCERFLRSSLLITRGDHDREIASAERHRLAMTVARPPIVCWYTRCSLSNRQYDNSDYNTPARTIAYRSRYCTLVRLWFCGGGRFFDAPANGGMRSAA